MMKTVPDSLNFISDYPSGTPAVQANFPGINFVQ